MFCIISSISSKHLFFIKSAISYLVVIFKCFNLSAKFSAVNLVNSLVVIYLS